MKGIILAGGSGTRLHPMTKALCKQLMPVYDKPMIYYPLSTLVYLDITEILIISTASDTPKIKNLLGNGKKYGIQLSYQIQDCPRGIADAFLIGESFIADDSVALILGDNIFYGPDFNTLSDVVTLRDGAIILAYHVNDPQRYGIVEFDNTGKAICLEEKPNIPKSNWAVPGLYFYDNKVVNMAKNLKLSERGELEITDINQIYLEREKLSIRQLRRGFAWLDAGTPDSLLESALFVQTIQKRQGLKISCLEEVCYQKGLISKKQLLNLASEYSSNNDYGNYLKSVI